jgi:hypothetical protein
VCEQIPQGDAVLALGGELRPVVRDRAVEVEVEVEYTVVNE